MYAFKNRNHIKLLFWKLGLRCLYKVLYGLDYILPTDCLDRCFGYSTFTVCFHFFLTSLQKLLFLSLVLWLVPVTSRELQEQRCLLPACSSFGVPLSRAPTLCVVPEES